MYVIVPAQMCLCSLTKNTDSQSGDIQGLAMFYQTFIAHGQTVQGM